MCALVALFVRTGNAAEPVNDKQANGHQNEGLLRRSKAPTLVVGDVGVAEFDSVVSPLPEQIAFEVEADKSV